MASSAPASREEITDENTPLLHPVSEDQPTHVEDEPNTQQPPRVSNYGWFFGGTIASLTLGVHVVAFLIATFTMRSYGHRRFGFYEYYPFDELMGIVGSAVSNG